MLFYNSVHSYAPCVAVLYHVKCFYLLRLSRNALRTVLQASIQKYMDELSAFTSIQVDLLLMLLYYNDVLHVLSSQCLVCGKII